jgi:hypothetical protein
MLNAKAHFELAVQVEPEINYFSDKMGRLPFKKQLIK